MKAQINKPSLSPRVIKEIQIGMSNVVLDYGQPNMQGRDIFGALIPFDRVWRTGANSNTKISFSTDVSLAENIIPAGTYGLYTIPNEKEWSIIIHKNSELWGDSGYDKTNDLVRFKVPVVNLADTLETLQIYFENFNTNGGDMIIAWENTKLIIPLYVDSDKQIYKEIEEKILNATGFVNAQTYFDAAQFYYLKEKNPKLALEWFDKAIEISPRSFWYVYYKAELSYSIGEIQVAKQLALFCLESAKENESSDFGYIAKCNLLLDEIRNKEN